MSNTSSRDMSFFGFSGAQRVDDRLQKEAIMIRAMRNDERICHPRSHVQKLRSRRIRFEPEVRQDSRKYSRIIATR
jgi:hypothetical protein